MSKPIQNNITIYQGATFVADFRWSAGDPPEPVDLTGCIGRMQIRANTASPTVLLDLNTTNGRITMDADGRIIVRVEAVDTAAITWKSGVYDLEIEFADGFVRRFMQGNVNVSPEVTRS